MLHRISNVDSMCLLMTGQNPYNPLSESWSIDFLLLSLIPLEKLLLDLKLTTACSLRQAKSHFQWNQTSLYKPKD